MTDRPITAQSSLQKDLEIEFWRLRIYSLGFLVAFALHLLIDGVARWPLLSLITVVSLFWGMWSGRGLWLRVAVVSGVFHALVFPIFYEVITHDQTVVTAVAQAPIWPQLLVTLIGARALANEGKLAFIQFWRYPIQRQSAIEIQSILSAAVLGTFLTLVFYTTVPHAISPGSKQTSAAIVSAMLGTTIIHTAIIFLFFVIVAAICDAALLYVMDRSLLASVRRLIEKEQKLSSSRGLVAILNEFNAASHSRSIRVLNAAIEASEAEGVSVVKLAGLSFDGFQMASRQFVRGLLSFLPLLGFLGTVIGLAAAISELPKGIVDGAGQGFDFSASLAGLAIKFETTLLGLIGSMICSLLLNFLEKREAELIAECMLVVKDAGERNV